MNVEIQVVFFSLLAAAGWGASDFLGGFTSKDDPPVSVVRFSILIGWIPAILLALLLREPVPPTGEWLWACLAGLIAAGYFYLLYRSLAEGKMSIVAPISGVVAIMMAATVGMLVEGLPSASQLVGFAVALVGIWLLSRLETSNLRMKDLALPVSAGLIAGFFYAIMDQASQSSTFWPIVVERAVAFGVLSLAAPWATAGAVRQIPRRWKLVAWIGLIDTVATLLFIMAVQSGRLDVTSLLASLYPAFTVLFAWKILKEKMIASQWVGLAITLAAIALIAS